MRAIRSKRLNATGLCCCLCFHCAEGMHCGNHSRGCHEIPQVISRTYRYLGK